MVFSIAVGVQLRVVQVENFVLVCSRSNFHQRKYWSTARDVWYFHLQAVANKKYTERISNYKSKQVHCYRIMEKARCNYENFSSLLLFNKLPNGMSTYFFCKYKNFFYFIPQRRNFWQVRHRHRELVLKCK